MGAESPAVLAPGYPRPWLLALGQRPGAALPRVRPGQPCGSTALDHPVLEATAATEIAEQPWRVISSKNRRGLRLTKCRLAFGASRPGGCSAASFLRLGYALISDIVNGGKRGSWRLRPSLPPVSSLAIGLLVMAANVAASSGAGGGRQHAAG